MPPRTPQPVVNVCAAGVRAARKNRGWSQQTMATRCQLAGWDVTRQTIKEIEHVRRTVTDVELVLFADIFQCTTDELLGLRSRLENHGPR